MSVNNNRITRKRGKNYEKYIAKRLNGKRIGILGKEDVDHELFSIECKERNSASSLEKFMIQAEKNCRPGKIPIVFRHTLNNNYDNDLSILRLKDLEKLLILISGGK